MSSLKNSISACVQDQLTRVKRSKNPLYSPECKKPLICLQIKGFACLVAWDGIEPSTRGFSRQLSLTSCGWVSLRIATVFSVCRTGWVVVPNQLTELCRTLAEPAVPNALVQNAEVAANSPTKPSTAAMRPQQSVVIAFRQAVMQRLQSVAWTTDLTASTRKPTFDLQ